MAILTRILCTILVSAVSIVSACAQTRQPISIGVSSSSLGAASMRLANEMGLFQKHGLEPKFVIMDSGNTAAAALISRSVDVIQAGMGELVATQARGLKVVAVVNVYGRPSGTLVLAKGVADKLGISPNASVNERLKALEGLVIGATTATSSNTISLRAAAQRAGANFRTVYMGQAEMPAALESGAVQGLFSASPFWTFPTTRGTGVYWLSGPKGDLPADLSTSSASQVQMMRAFAEANPELVQRLRTIYDDFRKALSERPADVKIAIAKLYPDMDPKSIDVLYEGEASAWNAKVLTPEDVLKEINFMKASGMQLPGIDQIDTASALLK